MRLEIELKFFRIFLKCWWGEQVVVVVLVEIALKFVQAALQRNLPPQEIYIDHWLLILLKFYTVSKNIDFVNSVIVIWLCQKGYDAILEIYAEATWATY